MKVAFIYDAVYPFVIGGAEHRYYELARQLRATHGVAFYSFGYWHHDTSGCLEGCRYVSVAAPRGLYDSHGRRRILEALRFSIRLFPRLLASREEVWDVCSFPYFSVLTARIANVIRRRTMVVTWLEFWGTYWDDYLGRWGFLGRWVETLAVLASPHIIAISDRTRDRLIAAGCPREKITVITPGVVLPPTAKHRGNTRFELVYVGRLIVHKRVDLAVLAVAALKQNGVFVRLGIVGEGPERQKLESLCATEGVEDRVTFLGRLPTSADVFATLHTSRVLVLPSQREGFGLAVIQGWACGIPAVVCAEPLNAMADLITAPHLGRVVPAVPAEIAAACHELLSEHSAERRECLIAAAAGRPWSDVADHLLATYGATGRKASTQ
jgi:glycosyltransferase involved in cell wall biosynthesis